MLGLDILDVAIGLIFVYLLLSLICSAVNEIIEACLKNRATDLERGLRELLCEPNGTGLLQDLFNHPLINGLFKGDYDPTKLGLGMRVLGKVNLPSYIPARSFALALMDTILPGKVASAGGAAGSTPATAALTVPVATASANALPLFEFKKSIEQLPNEHVRQALMSLVDAAGSDAVKVRENIEEWFNTSMDRVAGWYKRRTQIVLLILGLVVAGILNADSIAIVRTLSTDKGVRDALVAAAQQTVKSPPPGTTSPGAGSTAPNTNNASTKPCEGAAKDSPECRFQENLQQLKQLSLPIGWTRAEGTLQSIPQSKLAWLAKLAGWILTAFAISLGAPFWFDLLNKFIVVRSTVKPKEKSPEEKPKS